MNFSFLDSTDTKAATMDPRRQGTKRAAKPALSNEEKFRAVCRVTKDGESKASVARDIGVPESTLRGWCKNAKKIEDMVHRQSSPVNELNEYGAHINSSKRMKLEQYQAVAALGMLMTESNGGLMTETNGGLMTETNGALNLSTRSNSPSTSPCGSFESDQPLSMVSNVNTVKNDTDRQRKNVAILGKILFDPHLARLCMNHYPNHQPILTQLLTGTAAFLNSTGTSAAVMNDLNTVLHELCNYIDLEDFAIKHNIDYTINNNDEGVWHNKNNSRRTKTPSPTAAVFPTNFSNLQLNYHKYMMEAQYLQSSANIMSSLAAGDINNSIGLLKTVRPISPPKPVPVPVPVNNGAAEEASGSSHDRKDERNRDLIARKLEMAEEKQHQLQSLEQTILAHSAYLAANSFATGSSLLGATLERGKSPVSPPRNANNKHSGDESLVHDNSSSSASDDMPLDVSMKKAKNKEHVIVEPVDVTPSASSDSAQSEEFPVQKTIQNRVLSITGYRNLHKSRRKNIHPQRTSPGLCVAVANHPATVSNHCSADVLLDSSELTKQLACRQAENLLNLLECQQFANNRSSDQLSDALKSFLVDLKGQPL